MNKLIKKVTMTWKIHCYVWVGHLGFTDIWSINILINIGFIQISIFNICLVPFWRQMVAFLLIGVATYAKTSSIVVTLPIVGGMVACGVFLLFVAVLGLIATIKHHQVMLFFYMMILFVIFVIQFSVACACIGVNLEQEKKMSRTVSIRIP